MPTSSIDVLRNIATQLRIDSIRSTSEAGSGHPTTCMSAAEIVAALFFAEMRYDPQDPQQPRQRSIRAVEGARGADPLRRMGGGRVCSRARNCSSCGSIESDLEGHPTPRLPFVDVATGSLGQGICAAIGIALNARRIGSEYRTYVLLGDGEMAEGSVWEAARRRAALQAGQPVRHHRRQRARPEPAHAVRPQHGRIARALERVRVARASSSTATTCRRMLDAFDEARATKGRPTMILARTIKGKGVASIEGKDGWHGKALKKGEEADQRDRGAARSRSCRRRRSRRSAGRARPSRAEAAPDYSKCRAPAYKLGDQVATREAWGAALAAVGDVDPARRRARCRRQELDLQRQVRKGVRRTGSSRTSSPSRSWSVRRWGWRPAARFRSRRRSRAS